MDNKVFRVKRLRAQIKRFAPIFFLLIALFFLFGIKNSHPLLEASRIKTLNFFTPVINVLYTPIEWIKSISSNIQNIFSVYNLNKKLLKENANLRQKTLLLDNLALENERLKRQWNYISLPYVLKISTSVISDENFMSSKTVLTPAGKQHGVKKGFTALTHHGLLGRVITTGNKFSRILLLTDYTSQIPVMIGPKRILAIASGNNSDLLELTSFPEESSFQIGDEVLTSGYGGVFPPGLKVGYITNISDNTIYIHPSFLKEQLDVIQLVDFGLLGILEETGACRE